MTPLEWAIAGGALAACGALGMTLLNVATWPRGSARGRTARPISVLIPARDEEAGIERCVRSVLASEHPIEEVVVFDDGSTDATPEILAALAAEDDRLRVETGGEALPPGWVGKPRACHELSQRARGEVLLFLDADTELDPSGVARIAGLFESKGASVVTAVPRQETGTWGERLILPLLHVTYTSWFPLALTYLSKDPRFLAANGQVMGITREAYDATGGFSAVRGEVVDDMALCRVMKESGERVVFADGHHIATCRMYTSAEEVWEGFSKNIYLGLGASPFALAVVIALYSGAFVLPYVGLGAWGMGWIGERAGVMSAAGVGASVVMRAVLALRHGHAASGVLTHPLGVLGLLAIAVNSWRWYARGTIKWAGRTYDAA
jgi:chlorobactene glucosyltransferase